MLSINMDDVIKVLNSIKSQLIGFGVVAVLLIAVMIACRKNYLFLGSGNKIRRVHQLFSQCSVMLPPCCPTVVRTLFRSDPCFGRPSASSTGEVSV